MRSPAEPRDRHLLCGASARRRPTSASRVASGRVNANTDRDAHSRKDFLPVPAPVTGGHCFCGFIRFEIDGPLFHETICHCSMCRRVSGAPVVAWATAKSASFRVVAGTPATFRSSDHATRSFCPRCGTALTFQSDDLPGEIDVTICSLDDPASVAPQDHTRTSARLPWIRLADDLPAFPETRPARTGGALVNDY